MDIRLDAGAREMEPKAIPVFMADGKLMINAAFILWRQFQIRCP